MTIQRTASLTVRPEGPVRALDTIGRLVAHVGTEPGTLLYLSRRSETRPYEFARFMSFVGTDAEQAHASSDAVRAFTEALYPLCVEPPTFEERHAVRERGSKDPR